MSYFECVLNSGFPPKKARFINLRNCHLKKWFEGRQAIKPCSDSFSQWTQQSLRYPLDFIRMEWSHGSCRSGGGIGGDVTLFLPKKDGQFTLFQFGVVWSLIFIPYVFLFHSYIPGGGMGGNFSILPISLIFFIFCRWIFVDFVKIPMNSCPINSHLFTRCIWDWLFLGLPHPKGGPHHFHYDGFVKSNEFL